MKEISDVMDISWLSPVTKNLKRVCTYLHLNFLFVYTKLSSMAIAATTFMTVSFGSMLRMDFIFECCVFMLDEARKCDYMLYNKSRECWMLDVGCWMLDVGYVCARLYFRCF